jgi:hypothetical protein
MIVNVGKIWKQTSKKIVLLWKCFLQTHKLLFKYAIEQIILVWNLVARKANWNGFFRSQVLLKGSEIPEFRNKQESGFLKSSEIPEFRNNLSFFFLIILNSGEKI